MTDINTSNPITAPNPSTNSTLPDWCYCVRPSSGALIIVERDVRGYGKASDSTNDPQKNRELAREYNAGLGVTPRQEAAMLGGFLFGWDAPEAHLYAYAENGDPLSPSQQKKAAEQSAESRFLNAPADAFAIYQLKQTEQTRDLRFEPLARLQLTGRAVDRVNYECVYTAPLPTNAPNAPLYRLNALYEQLNLDRPADFTGHSLSVGDVVALKQNDGITCHYVDSWRFAEQLKPKPPNREHISKTPKKNTERDCER